MPWTSAPVPSTVVQWLFPGVLLRPHKVSLPATSSTSTSLLQVLLPWGLQKYLGPSGKAWLLSWRHTQNINSQSKLVTVSLAQDIAQKPLHGHHLRVCWTKLFIFALTPVIAPFKTHINKRLNKEKGWPKGPFRVLFCLCFKTSLSANLSYENEFCMQFHFYANQSHFHKNCSLLDSFKQRHKGLCDGLLTGRTTID